MKKYKVLIIDDDKFLLGMYLVKFKERGFDVTPSSGSQDTISKLKEGDSFDIILMDIVMPVMDGFELLENVKTEGLSGNSKIIMLSNLGQSSDVDKGYKLGADGYIIKASTTPSGVVDEVLKIVEVKKTKEKSKKIKIKKENGK